MFLWGNNNYHILYLFFGLLHTFYWSRDLARIPRQRHNKVSFFCLFIYLFFLLKQLSPTYGMEEKKKHQTSSQCVEQKKNPPVGDKNTYTLSKAV